MRIDYLQLENIKSYRAPTRIDLTEGVNAICGLNGSGKTTLLEAIGYALFGSLVYSQAAFVREGEKFGTIRVGLCDRDERRYEVIRRIGRSASHVVIDAETGTRIADSKEVFAWIRSHALQLEGDVDLSTLFENAVGVPQGMLTSDFLRAAGQRKSIFDPLLRVEEYRHAYEQLRDTVTFLRDRSTQEDQAIAGLRTDTDRIPDTLNAFQTLSAQVAESRSLLQHVETEAAQLRAQCRELDDLERRLLLLQQEVRGAEYDVQRARDLQGQRADEVMVAEQAAREVSASEQGYRQTLEARERLSDLEAARLQRDQLIVQHAEARTDARGIFGQIEQLDRELQQARDAAAEAAGLNEVVSRQRLLEDELRELEVGLRDLTRLETELADLREEIDRSQKDLIGLDRRLAETMRAERIAGGLPAAEEALEVVKRELAELPALRSERDRIRREGTRLKAERTRLNDEMNRWRVAEERRVALEPVAASVNDLQAAVTELRELRAVHRATLTYQQMARRELAAGNCPLISQPCPVVAGNPGVLTRLDSSDDQVATTLENVERDLLTREEELAKARSAGAEYQELLLRSVPLEHDESVLEAVETELRACSQQFQEVSGKLERETYLQAQHESELQHLRQVQAEARKAAERPVLEEQRRRDAHALERRQQHLERILERHVTLSATSPKAALLAREIAALGDPHGRQRELLTLAGRRDFIEQQLTQQQARLADTAGRVKALSARLEEFNRLDDEIASERERERTAMADYERYLQHVGVAEQLPERREAFAAQATIRQQTESILSEAVARRDALLAEYDSKHHGEVKQAAEAADREAVKQGAVHQHLESDLKRVADDLANLRRKDEILQRHLAERGRLADTERAIKFIRETVNAAGPAVTEALLQTISQGANDIYAEIIDDHAVELRWDRDYEILIQHGPETRKFAQLSGGEQMGAALAVRLALLKEMSEVDFAFFDEPTQNMDAERRSNLADQIRQIRGFSQLIVISHDDTFEHHTDNVIRLRKIHGETAVETDVAAG